MENKEIKFEKLKEKVNISELTTFFSKELLPILNSIIELEYNSGFEYISSEDKVKNENYLTELKELIEKRKKKKNSGKCIDDQNIFEKKENIISREKSFDKKVEDLHDKRENNLNKRIMSIIFKTAITNLIVEATQKISKKGLGPKQFYLTKEELVKGLKVVLADKVTETDEKSKKIYDEQVFSFNKKERNLFLLNDSNYFKWFEFLQEVKFVPEKDFNLPVVKMLLSYYLYSVYQGGNENEFHLSNSSLFEKSVKNLGRNKRVYAYKKHTNFINKYPIIKNAKFEHINMKSLMSRNPEFTRDLSNENFRKIITSNNNQGFELLQSKFSDENFELFISDFKRLINFDRRYYYFLLKFYEFKSYALFTKYSRKKLGFSSSLNILILNKYDRLYDALYLTSIPKKLELELLNDEKSFAAIMKIDDFELKTTLLITYNKLLKFDYIGLKNKIDNLIEEVQKYLLCNIQKFFEIDAKSYEVYEIVLEFYDDFDDKQILKKVLKDFKRWDKLGDVEKIEFIEDFGNNLLLLHRLDVK